MSSQPRFARLTHRALVRLTGPDWRSFLQGLITQDVESQSVGELRYGALLTPQGRLLHDLFVLAAEDGALLDVQAAQRDALVSRLAMYRLRAKVDIAPVDGGVFALWNTGEAPETWAADPRLPGLGFRWLREEVPNADAAETVSGEAYDAHRLAFGVPDPARDCPDDKTYPIEANFDLLNGIDFKKGCFVGQETTSRMKRRGLVKTRMVPLSFDGETPPFGTEVLAGDLRAGEVLSGRQGRALALLRLDRAMGAQLQVQGRPVRLDPPPWLASALSGPELAQAPA